jgi:hypothetical protein
LTFQFHTGQKLLVTELLNDPDVLRLHVEDAGDIGIEGLFKEIIKSVKLKVSISKTQFLNF